MKKIIVSFILVVFSLNYYVYGESEYSCFYEDRGKPYTHFDNSTLVYINSAVLPFIHEKSEEELTGLVKALESKRSLLDIQRSKYISENVFGNKKNILCELDVNHFLGNRKDATSYLILDFLIKRLQAELNVNSRLTIRTSLVTDNKDIFYSYPLKHYYLDNTGSIEFTYTNLISHDDRIRPYGGLFEDLINTISRDDIVEYIESPEYGKTYVTSLPLNNSAFDSVDLSFSKGPFTKRLSETHFYDDYMRKKTEIYNKVNLLDSGHRLYHYNKILLETYSQGGLDISIQKLLESPNVYDLLNEKNSIGVQYGKKYASKEYLKEYYYDLKPGDGTTVEILEVDHIEDTVTYEIDYSVLREKSFILDSETLGIYSTVVGVGYEGLKCDKLLNQVGELNYLSSNELWNQPYLDFCKHTKK